MTFEWFLYSVISSCYSSKNKVLTFKLQIVNVKVADPRMEIFDDNITANESSKRRVI